MGNAIASSVPAPNAPSALLRLRRGKKNVGCPCFLADEASTWEAVTQDPKFRPYVLRHLLDEGFICSILEHGEREHGLTACVGVQYYQVSCISGQLYVWDLEIPRTADTKPLDAHETSPTATATVRLHQDVVVHVFSALRKQCSVLL